MSELTQTLKILVTRYPGTMAELARKASIDRSTLYKIVSGQRTPREFQLEHLADALELSEEQKSALLLQYKQRGRGPDPRLRAELHHLLEVSFRVEDFTHREGIISNEAASQLRCSEQYIEGSRAVAAAVASGATQFSPTPRNTSLRASLLIPNRSSRTFGRLPCAKTLPSKTRDTRGGRGGERAQEKWAPPKQEAGAAPGRRSSVESRCSSSLSVSAVTRDGAP